MKAMLLEAPSELVMREMADPVAGTGEVMIRVAACGICGSDVHGYDGSSGRRIPPLVMGHEAAGTVAAVGAGVARFAVGDRVTFDSTVYCGECFFCARGEINLCDRREVVGVSCQEFRRHGAFAELVAVPERIVHRLPEQMEFAEAAMLEAVAVALHAVHLTGVTPESGAESSVPSSVESSVDARVLVIGAGMIGLLIAQSLKALGYRRVMVADVDETRLRLAREMGATETVLASGEELVRRVHAATEGRGVDAVLEAVGRDETVTAAIEAVKKGGTVTLVGNITPAVTLPLQRVVSRQIRLQGSCASCGEYPEAIALVSAGKIRVKPLITAVAPLEDGAEWFGRLHAREPNLMKIVLDPRLGA